MRKKDFETLSDFRYQLRRFLRFSEEVARSHGVTHLQYQLLLHVRGLPGREWATVSELAERLQSHHHGAVSLISRCEKLGLVRRQTGRNDRRAVEVHLTADGKKLLNTLVARHRDELLRLQGIFRVPGQEELDAGNPPDKP
jgi:DNA-binding MarR family transcriptional regulator